MNGQRERAQWMRQPTEKTDDRPVATACASLKALSAESDLLWRFEEKDEDDEVEAFCPKANLQSSAMSSSDEEDDHRSHRRSVNSYYRWQPPRKAGDFGRRVKKYSEQRRAECQAVEEVGLANPASDQHMLLTVTTTSLAWKSPALCRGTPLRARRSRGRPLRVRPVSRTQENVKSRITVSWSTVAEANLLILQDRRASHRYRALRSQSVRRSS